MTRQPVAAKINLAHVVGGRRDDGLHEVASVLQRIDLCDWITVVRDGDGIAVDGFTRDTLVRGALARLAETAHVEPGWRVRLEKTIPVAAGLGGGSADAAAALRLANATLREPLPHERLLEVAAAVGSDVPFFLDPGPKLAGRGGERLTSLQLPQDFWVVVALPRRARKASTAEVYRRFDELGGGDGFAERREHLLSALAACRRPRDFAEFPPNDLAEAAGRPPLLGVLAARAFRADVTGAGPAVYALFHHLPDARAAARRVRPRARTWVTAPVW
jgi:4-diphosphocytidyl-2-C-methyl-D-erythritol kinase